jgi:catechol 2,3-dioxygenase-like lactoylglutathione lyase family enzyme
MTPRLNYVGIVASDLNASRAFYALLGLEFEGQGVHFEAIGEGFRVGLDAESLIREMMPNWVTPAGQRVGIAFECDSPAGVDQVYESVTAAGYSGAKEPFDAVWGQRYATLKDPDGNLVDLYAFLPN